MHHVQGTYTSRLLRSPWCLKLEFSKLNHACAIIRNLINAPAEALDYKKYTCIFVL